MTRGAVLEKLPPFSNRYKMIRKNQTVNDIVNEVLAAHEVFKPDYNAIAGEFYQGNNVETAKALFNFLKKNVQYKIETEANQTTKSPAAIVETAQGDCKHYSGFVAGVLDALTRAGIKIDWCYRFASYNFLDNQPQHVFVVMKDGGKEYWIDPVLKTFNEKLEPAFFVDKKPNYMLQRLSGVEEIEAGFDDDSDLPIEVKEAILLLYNNGILNQEGAVNDALILQLSKSLPQDEFDKIAKARLLLHEASIGGFFSDLWSGVKKVTLAPPRNAYLALVAVNAFGLATKLKHALYNKDGSYNLTGKDKLTNIWVKKFAGNFTNFENAIKSGSKKSAILGATHSAEIGAAQAAIPAWVAIASAIIAALAPVIKDIISSQASSGQLPAGVDPYTGLPYGMNSQISTGFDVVDFVKQNPLIVVGVAAVGVYFFTKPKRRSANV